MRRSATALLTIKLAPGPLCVYTPASLQTLYKGPCLRLAPPSRVAAALPRLGRRNLPLEHLRIQRRLLGDALLYVCYRIE